MTQEKYATLEERVNQLKILKEIVEKYDLKTDSRKDQYKWRRHSFCQLVRPLGYSLDYIGDMVNRSHSNVVNSIKVANNCDETNDTEYQLMVAPLAMDLKEANLKKIREVRGRGNPNNKINPFIKILNKFFEINTTDAEQCVKDVENLKVFVNENINSKQLKS